jgi:hypothetical protein
LEDEGEETASSRKRCMTPRVSSILGFPEEKGKAWVKAESEEEEEEEGVVESPEIIAAGDRNASSFEGPAGTELELVDMVCERETVSSTEIQRNGTIFSFFLSFSLSFSAAW